MHFELNKKETDLLYERGWFLKKVDGKHYLFTFNFYEDEYNKGYHEVIDIEKEESVKSFSIKLNAEEDEEEEDE